MNALDIINKSLNGHKFLIKRDRHNLIHGDSGRIVRKVYDINYKTLLCTVIFDNGELSGWYNLSDLILIKKDLIHRKMESLDWSICKSMSFIWHKNLTYDWAKVTCPKCLKEKHNYI